MSSFRIWAAIVSTTEQRAHGARELHNRLLGRYRDSAGDSALSSKGAEEQQPTEQAGGDKHPGEHPGQEQDDGSDRHSAIARSIQALL
eukprot:13546646-Heterocapsa_arctica.AAC.1